MEHKHHPTREIQAALEAARSKTQWTARHCANDYWLKLCEGIQTAADKGDIRGMYDRIKKAIGPPQRKTTLLKTKTRATITSKVEQMERWGTALFQTLLPRQPDFGGSIE